MIYLQLKYMWKKHEKKGKFIECIQKKIYTTLRNFYTFFFFDFILENTYKKKLYPVLSIGSK